MIKAVRSPMIIIIIPIQHKSFIRKGIFLISHAHGLITPIIPLICSINAKIAATLGVRICHRFVELDIFPQIVLEVVFSIFLFRYYLSRSLLELINRSISNKWLERGRGLITTSDQVIIRSLIASFLPARVNILYMLVMVFLSVVMLCVVLVLLVVFVNVVVDMVVSVLVTVDVVIGVSVIMRVGLLVFVESLVGMEMIVLVDVVVAVTNTSTGLEEIILKIILVDLLLGLFALQFWKRKLWLFLLCR